MRRKALTRRIEAVLEYIRRGHSVKEACALAGVPRASFYKRLDTDPKLQERVEQAECECVDLALQNVRNKLLEGDVRVSMWVLERRLPEVWGANPKLREPKLVDIEPEFVLAEEPLFRVEGEGA